MEYFFLSKLSENYIKQIGVLFNQIEFSSIEQYPGFAEIAYPNEKTIHSIMLSNNEIVGYAQIKIKKNLLAIIYFGPIVKSENDFVVFIKEIKIYCKKKFIPLLKIFPPRYTKEYSPSFWKKLKDETDFEVSDSGFNWSTLLLPINLSDEEILKNFSENHQRSIKKAIKTGLKSRLIKQEDIGVYNQQYCEMYASRGIKINPIDNFKKVSGMFRFFENNHTGFFMGVWQENQLIGGLCISFGTNVAFYSEGYSHPDFREFPISHLAFYESMKFARDKGVSYFDFGGYAINTKEGEQLFQINRFKDGFKGELIHYSKTMIFYTSLAAKWIYKLILFIRKQ